MIYIFSDGYADQFGGPKGKKLKYKPFKELLIKNSKASMEEQEKQLDNLFENWKGELEQLDDVCVIGVRI
jgi:ribosomal protein L9